MTCGVEFIDWEVKFGKDVSEWSYSIHGKDMI